MSSVDNKQYTPQQIKRFSNREKRIMFQSIFSSLCSTRKDETINDLRDKAIEITEEIAQKYPTEDEEIKEQELAKTKEKLGIPPDQPF